MRVSVDVTRRCIVHCALYMVQCVRVSVCQCVRVSACQGIKASGYRGIRVLLYMRHACNNVTGCEDRRKGSAGGWDSDLVALGCAPCSQDKLPQNNRKLTSLGVLTSTAACISVLSVSVSPSFEALNSSCNACAYDSNEIIATTATTRSVVLRG